MLAFETLHNFLDTAKAYIIGVIYVASISSQLKR
jgi:hypothetical protein